ncbi:hypothetical protein IscW_ISCW022834, partial [Ixodes scapularis]
LEIPDSQLGARWKNASGQDASLDPATSTRATRDGRPCLMAGPLGGTGEPFPSNKL